MRAIRHTMSLLATVAVVGGVSLLGMRPPAQMEALAARIEPPGPAARPSSPAFPVRASLARLERVPLVRTGVGWVEPMTTVKVRARIDGEIVERLVQDGSVVAEGDVLFRIDDSEMRAIVARDEAALARDRAVHSRLEADLARAVELRARHVATQMQVDQLTADTRAAAATATAAEATLRASRIKLGYTVVRAPIAGRVGVVRSARGDLVGPAEGPAAALLTITSMSPLQVSFTLPERDLDALRATMLHHDGRPQDGRPTVSVVVGGSDHPAATGRLRFVDSSVDTATGTILVKALVPNKDGVLWPGQYARASVTLHEGVETLIVPAAALQQDQKGASVFVVRPDGSAERRSVDATEVGGGLAAIRAGVSLGERVIVEGQARLFEGAPVTIVSSEVASASGTDVR